MKKIAKFFEKVWIVILVFCGCHLNAKNEEMLLEFHPWILRPVLGKYLHNNLFSRYFCYEKIFKRPPEIITIVLEEFCKKRKFYMQKPAVQGGILELPIEQVEKFCSWIAGESYFCDEAFRKLLALVAKHPEREELIASLLNYVIEEGLSDEDQCYILTVAEKEGEEGLPLDLAIRLASAYSDEDGDARLFCDGAECKLLQLLGAHPECAELLTLILTYIESRGLGDKAQAYMLTEAKNEGEDGLPLDLAIRLASAFINGIDEDGKPFEFCDEADCKLLQLLGAHPECTELLMLILTYIESKYFCDEAETYMLTEAKNEGEDGLPLDSVIRLASAYINRVDEDGDARMLYDEAECKLLQLLGAHPECAELLTLILTYIGSRGLSDKAQAYMLTEAQNEGEDGLPLDSVIRLASAFINGVDEDGKARMLCNEADCKLLQLLGAHPECEELLKLILTYLKGWDFCHEAQAYMLTIAENKGEKGLPLDLVIRLAIAFINGGDKDCRFCDEVEGKLLDILTMSSKFKQPLLEYVSINTLSEQTLLEMLDLPKELVGSILDKHARMHGFPAKVRDVLMLRSCMNL